MCEEKPKLKRKRKLNIDWELPAQDKAQIIMELIDDMPEREKVKTFIHILNNLSAKTIAKAFNRTVLQGSPFRFKARGARID